MYIEDELYQKIIRIMPIPCVDLLITDNIPNILLVKRKNQPYIGQWFTPGGRINYSESREDAAKRKLKEECSLETSYIKEFKTYDFFAHIDNIPQDYASHCITTVYHVIPKDFDIILDDQGSEYAWKHIEEWMGMGLPLFVATVLWDFINRERNK